MPEGAPKIPHTAEASGIRTPEYYERLLNDPESPLPKTHLVFIRERKHSQPFAKAINGDVYAEHVTTYRITDAKGKKIGLLRINGEAFGESKPSTVHIEHVYINKNLRGKNRGYGRSVYMELLKELTKRNLHLVSGVELSPGSQSMWDWLVEKGAAVQTNGIYEDDAVYTSGDSTYAKYEIL